MHSQRGGPSIRALDPCPSLNSQMRSKEADQKVAMRLASCCGALPAKLQGHQQEKQAAGKHAM